MTVAEFATKRVVSTTMILIFMIFAGWVAMTGMKQERIPDYDIPIVVVNATWTGATAEDVKTQVSKKIEDAALNVDGIKNITTSSSYGSSVVTIEFNYGVDTDIKQVQVQTQIDKIKGQLPDDDNFKDPTVSKLDIAGSSNMALMIGITGKNKELITSFVEETLQPRLKRNRGIGNISVMGNATRQIKVWLDPARLKEYNLSAAEIYSKIKAANTVTPAGTITDGTKEFILKVDGELKELDQIQDIVISNQNNQTVRLADVAKVEYGTEDPTSYVTYNGKEMVAVMIQKSKDGNLVEVAKKAKETLKEAKPLFPEGSSYNIIVDNSEKVSESIKNVTDEFSERLFKDFNNKFTKNTIDSFERFTSVFYSFATDYLQIKDEEYSPIIIVLDVKFKGKEIHYKILFQLEKYDENWNKIEEINFTPQTQIIYR